MYDSSAGPWGHPDWYDLHDNAAVSGVEREPEHYREFVLALPPLLEEDHLVDIGAGTGKLSALVVAAYPRIGRVSLVDPNASKLERALDRVRPLMHKGKVDTHVGTIGFQHPWLPARPATVVLVGSVLMPLMMLRGGSLGAGTSWVSGALRDIRELGLEGTRYYFLETVSMEWVQGSTSDTLRRLKCAELIQAMVSAGFLDVQCLYRFRDRVILSGRHATAEESSQAPKPPD